MAKEFVPTNFTVPITLRKEYFRLEILTPTVVELDYEAVMSSKESLRQIFSKNDDWPSDDMTLEENNDDLVMHLKEFDNREAFAYTVLTPDKSKCIGCLYINPCKLDDYDCEVYFWIRDDSIQLDAEFFNVIKKWLSEAWPFKSIAWPGREINWENWD
jgi:hypothetical protein